ncbi:hypothetical protein ABC347_17285 [Sphingomonas sp. 1P06PA]|uniref:hypothetical protein n=1 Tax=Sphingomonas sp. 1P06PA TaxID=554121 RepID=UPI0039A6E634
MTLERAHITMVRGAEFLAGWSDQEAGAVQPDAARTRFIGNALRELDRFLSVLADEAAACLAPADHDRPGFARLRNAPNKLRAVNAMMDLPSPAHEPLRAIGRLRACLHHCHGHVRSGGLGADLPSAIAAAGSIGALRHEGDAIMLTVPAEQLANISRSYRSIADDLVEHVRARRPLH